MDVSLSIDTIAGKNDAGFELAKAMSGVRDRYISNEAASVHEQQ
jgi:hypothetical protein